MTQNLRHINVPTISEKLTNSCEKCNSESLCRQKDKIFQINEILSEGKLHLKIQKDDERSQAKSMSSD